MIWIKNKRGDFRTPSRMFFVEKSLHLEWWNVFFCDTAIGTNPLGTTKTAYLGRKKCERVFNRLKNRLEIDT